MDEIDRQEEEYSECESETSGEELPIWVRGEKRFVSGIVSQTTCRDVISVLLKDEEARVSSTTTT